MAIEQRFTDINPRSFKLPATIRTFSEQSIISFVMDRDNEARFSRAHTTLRDNYTDLRNAYNGKFKRDQNIPKWRNRLYNRLSFKIVETMRAFMDDALLGSNPLLGLEPRHVIRTQNAKNMEGILQHEAEFTRKRKKYQNVINSTLKYGIGVTRNFWNFKRSFRPIRMFERDENGNIVETGQKEEPYIKIDSPDFKWIDPIKVAFDPLNDNIRDMRYAIEEMDIDFDELIASRETQGLFNLDELQRDVKGASVGVSANRGFGSDPFLDRNYTGTFGEENRQAAFDEHRKRVRLMMYEGRLDMPGNDRDPRIYEVWVANDKHLIKVRRSQYAFDQLTYNIHNIIPQEDNFVGIGAIEPILTDQRILNILTNTRLDSLHLIISPRMLAHKNSIEPGINSLNSVPPGGFINVKSLGDLNRVVKQVEIADQGFASWQQWIAFQQNHSEQTMAANPNQSGSLSPQRRSATEVLRALEGANARFIHMLNYFIESGYYDHSTKEMMMVQQFMTKEKRVKITGDLGAGELDQIIRPWDIQGDFMMKRIDPTKGNKDVESTLWINTLTALAPYFQATGLDPLPFVKGILEASPLHKKLNLAKMFPGQFNPDQSNILDNENKRLEKAFLSPEGSLPEERLQGREAPGVGTPPGGGSAPGAPPISIGRGPETALGIAQAGL